VKKPISVPPETVSCWLDLAATRDKSHIHRASLTIDTEAAGLLKQAFVQQGARPGRSTYSHPRDPEADPTAPARKLLRPLGPGLRFVRASRPALHEDRVATNRVRKPGDTELENPFHAYWRPVFSFLRRNIVILAEHFADLLLEDFEDRRDLQVSVRMGSRYKRVGGVEVGPKEPRCAVFLMNVPEFHRGVALTSLFGMCGLSGLIGSQLVTERHPEWLTQPGVRMIELVGTPIPRDAEDLSYTDSWQVLSLFHAPVPAPQFRAEGRPRADGGAARFGASLAAG
jgi:hypothetical protein